MLEIQSESKYGSLLIKETYEYGNLSNPCTGREWLQPDVLGAGTSITTIWQKYGVFDQNAQYIIKTTRKYNYWSFDNEIQGGSINSTDPTKLDKPICLLAI